MNNEGALVVKEPKKRAGIQSVEIGMGVLDAVAGLGRASPLAAVVKRCGLSPSQTHRYLASLSASGMVRQDSNGFYDLGPAALKVGLGALARIDIFRIADDELSAFCAATGATVLLAALGPAGPTIVRWYAGRPPIITTLTIGSVLSVAHSATGQIFLAFRPDNETDHLVALELRHSPELVPDHIDQIKARVRKEGKAGVGGTVIPGLNAKAFPIFDLQGHAVLVATVLSTSAKQDKLSNDIATKLGATCNRISEMLGARPADGDKIR
jgi:DNA-binding IclR family transcriptional regulator